MSQPLPPVAPAPRLSLLTALGLPLLAAVLAGVIAWWRTEEGCMTVALAACAAAAAYFAMRQHAYRSQFEAQAALFAQNERTFTQALDSTMHGMALVSKDGKFLQTNRAFARITGYTEDELVKLDFQTITYPDDLNADLHFVEQVLSRKIETYSMEKRYIRKDSQVIWVLLTVSAMWDQAGNLRYFISEIQDINERKQLQEKLRAAEAKLRGQ